MKVETIQHQRTFSFYSDSMFQKRFMFKERIEK